MRRIKMLMPASTLVFTLFVICIMGCKDSDDELKKCVPLGAKIDGDSIAYVYNSDHRLTEIQYRTKTTVNKRYSISYSNNRVAKVTVINRNYLGVETEDESYDLLYGMNDLPKLMIYSQRKSRGMEKMDSVVFSYDDKNRLVKRDNWLIYADINVQRYHTRYEYSSGNNVAKIFYKLYSSPGAQELLGAEHISFDSHPRFFAGSEDLRMVQVYVLYQEPSENNILTAKVFGTDPYSWYTNGAFGNYQYSLTYDDQGNVKSHYVNSIALFHKISYTCF